MYIYTPDRNQKYDVIILGTIHCADCRYGIIDIIIISVSSSANVKAAHVITVTVVIRLTTTDVPIHEFLNQSILLTIK